MKFKAVTNAEAPQEFLNALDGLRSRLERDVVAGCFGVQAGTMGPAELYVQCSDLARKQRPFINYNGSAITLKEGRQFAAALRNIEDILVELVREHWDYAGKVQIFVVLATSDDNGKSQLFESQPFYVNATTGTRTEN